MIALLILLLFMAASARAEKCVWTIGGNAHGDEAVINQVRDNAVDFWNQNSNGGGLVNLTIGWGTAWAESLCTTNPCGTVGDNPVNCPFKFLWDALPDDECGPCPDAGGTCASQEYVHRTTRRMIHVWFDLTGIPSFVALDSAICSLYVAGYTGLGYPGVGGGTPCAPFNPRLDVIADTINQDWVEGATTTIGPFNPGAPCYKWSNSNVRGIPQPDSADQRYRSVGGTLWDCGEQDWIDGPHLRSPMAWLRNGVDVLTFDESTISEIPGYFGWDVTDIVQDMYNQQVLDTSDTGFGIAFYDTLFWADGQICESVGANISIFSREGNYGSAEQANGPKLVLWYECGEGDIPADTAQRPQLIYIND